LADLYNKQQQQDALFNQANQAFQFNTNSSMQNIVPSNSVISSSSISSFPSFNQTSIVPSSSSSTTTTSNLNGYSSLMTSKRKNSKCAIVRPLNEPRNQNDQSTTNNIKPQQPSMQYQLPPSSDQKPIVNSNNTQGIYPQSFLPVWPMPIYPFTM
jgi:hypothetical protein